ncbi:hypothetical protein VTK26DRAFT_4184 [Humicola hyalothermophila]
MRFTSSIHNRHHQTLTLTDFNATTTLPLTHHGPEPGPIPGDPRLALPSPATSAQVAGTPGADPGAEPQEGILGAAPELFPVE